jgi:hypothetical protein
MTPNNPDTGSDYPCTTIQVAQIGELQHLVLKRTTYRDFKPKQTLILAGKITLIDPI